MAIWSMKAAGNIPPCVFVKQQTTADNRVVLAGAGDIVFGVSQKGSRWTPLEGTSLDDGYVAISGEDVEVYGPHEVCLLQISATVTAGARLKSDASGYGTPVTTDKDQYGAVARVAGTSGQLIPVEVVPYQSADV